jgi:O-antigen/teichoic acid export membrane protein
MGGFSKGFLNSLLSFVFKGHERSVKAKKNIIGSLLIKGLSIGISLIFVPLTLNYLNPSNYGIWLTLSSMVAWIAFFDIGFTHGLRNKFAIAKANGDVELARIYISTAYYYISIIFIGLWFVLFVVNRFITWHGLLNISAEQEKEISTLVNIILTYFCFQFILRIISTVLIADQNPAKASFLDLISQFISLAVVFLLTLYTEGSLIYLGLAIGSVPILVLLIANVFFFKTQYRDYKPSFSHVKRKYASDLMSLGIKFFIPQIAFIVQFQTTSFLIAHFFSTVQVTNYNIAYRYFFTLQMVFSIMLAPLWSGVTDAYSKGDLQWIRNVVNKYLLMLLPFFVAGTVMLLFANHVYELWLGKGVVNIDFSISFLSYVFIMTGMVAGIFVPVLNGIGALTIQVFSAIITAFVFIGLSFILIKVFQFGVESILISLIISNFYGYVIAPVQYYMIFIKKSRTRIWYQ